MEIFDLQWADIFMHITVGLALMFLVFFVLAKRQGTSQQKAGGDYGIVAKWALRATGFAALVAFATTLLDPTAAGKPPVSTIDVVTVTPAQENIAAADMSAAAFTKQFQSALYGGDFKGVTTSFSPDATIFENGQRESSLKVYLRSHLKPEMPTLRAAKRQILKQEIVEDETTAVVTTASIITFLVAGKKRNFNSVETLHLAREGSGWRIKHVHWSSKPIPDK
jgi:ketosteroid isomerase-like protein